MLYFYSHIGCTTTQLTLPTTLPFSLTDFYYPDPFPLWNCTYGGKDGHLALWNPTSLSMMIFSQAHFHVNVTIHKGYTFYLFIYQCVPRLMLWLRYCEKFHQKHGSRYLCFMLILVYLYIHAVEIWLDCGSYFSVAIIKYHDQDNLESLFELMVPEG